MNELLALLKEFSQCLKIQINIYAEFLPLLDEEEHLLGCFSLPLLERIVVQKDQIVQRARRIEQRRLGVLNKICLLISFDTRKKPPSLNEFLIVLKHYAESLHQIQLAASVQQQIAEKIQEVEDIAKHYREFFVQTEGRVFRNKQIMQRLASHVERSVTFLQTAIKVPPHYASAYVPNYGPTGKPRDKTLSFLTIKV